MNLPTQKMIEQIVQELHSQGYTQQMNVLTQEELFRLQSLFNSDFMPARVGKAGGPQRVEEIRGDYISWIDPKVPPKEIQQPIEFLVELKSKLNEIFFLGLKDFECHLAKYPIGSFYKKHVDRFEQDSSRSVSFIFYLHQDWIKEDGGELVLYNKQQEELKTILPLPGSLIVFMSEDFPHEVKISHKERRSLTGWMHTKILA